MGAIGKDTLRQQKDIGSHEQRFAGADNDYGGLPAEGGSVVVVVGMGFEDWRNCCN